MAPSRPQACSSRAQLPQQVRQMTRYAALCELHCPGLVRQSRLSTSVSGRLLCTTVIERGLISGCCKSVRQTAISVEELRRLDSQSTKQDGATATGLWAGCRDVTRCWLTLSVQDAARVHIYSCCCCKVFLRLGSRS